MMGQKDWYVSWFNTDFYHDLYAKRNDEEARLFMDYLSSFFNWSDESVILDACCGAGRHALYLESKGLKVFGVDLSENNISEAKSKSQYESRWMVSDVRKFELSERADFVLNLFTSFGYFDDDQEHVKMLKNLKGNMKEGGVLVLDFLNVNQAISNLKREEIIQGKLTEYFVSKRISEGKILKDINFEYDGLKFSFQESVKAYTSNDIKRLIEMSGFEIVDKWGDYAGGPMTDASPRCIFVARNII